MRPFNWIKKIRTFPFLMALMGCSNYAEQFDCGPGKGIGCKSLSYVNKMVDRGALPFNEEEEFEPIKPLSNKTLCIWVAPYRQEDGTYHSASYMHISQEEEDRDA